MLLARVDRQRPVTAKIADRKYDLAQLCALIERGAGSRAQTAPRSPDRAVRHGQNDPAGSFVPGSGEAGIDAAFVDSIELRMLAANLTSRWDETARTAKNDLRAAHPAPCDLWSDVGDSTATEKAFPETVAAILSDSRAAW